MKFVCDACASRYYIDDAKVKNRVLRIRCKKCGFVMTVREAVAGSAVAQGPLSGTIPPQRTTAESERAPMPDSASESWFYAVSGQTFGPYSVEELLHRYASGRIGDETYAWSAGLGVWKPAVEVEPFGSAIRAAQAARSHAAATAEVALTQDSVSPGPHGGETSPGHPGHDGADGASSAESRARLAALREGLRKSRANQAVPMMPAAGPAAEPTDRVAELAGEPELADGSVAEATANLVTASRAPLPDRASATATGALSLPAWPPSSAQRSIIMPSPAAARDQADATAAPVSASMILPSPAAAADTNALTSTAPAAPATGARTTGTARATSRSSAIATSARAADLPPPPVSSSYNESLERPRIAATAPGLPQHVDYKDQASPSLLIQINQAQRAAQSRILLGLAVLVGLLAGTVIAAKLISSAGPEEQPTISAEEGKRIDPNMVVVGPEQIARLEQNRVAAFADAHRGIAAAVKAGGAAMAAEITARQIPAIEAEKRRRAEAGRSAPAVEEQPARVFYDEQTGRVEVEGGAEARRSVLARLSMFPGGPAGGGLQGAAAPATPRPRGQTDLPAGFLNSGFERVERAIQQCNQRQIAQEGRLERPRVKLDLTIEPNGTVSRLSLEDSISETAFGRCLRGKKDQWVFNRFEGEPLRVSKTYVVE